MKFPNHIILDVNKSFSKNIANYWIFMYIPSFSNSNSLNYVFKTHKRFNYEEPRLFKKFDFGRAACEYKLNSCYVSNTTRNAKLTPLCKLLKPRFKVLNRLQTSKHFVKNLYARFKKSLLFKTTENYRLHPFKNVIIKKSATLIKNFSIWRLFDINFLKKEPIYTKLKYSRTPQYDIVSGGAAALFAGFLGFLICEKFGLELLDSGDFYFLFMYAVFFFFFWKMLFKHVSLKSPLWGVNSGKWFYNFYRSLVILFLNYFFK